MLEITTSPMQMCLWSFSRVANLRHIKTTWLMSLTGGPGATLIMINIRSCGWTWAWDYREHCGTRQWDCSELQLPITDETKSNTWSTEAQDMLHRWVLLGGERYFLSKREWIIDSLFLQACYLWGLVLKRFYFLFFTNDRWLHYTNTVQYTWNTVGKG